MVSVTRIYVSSTCQHRGKTIVNYILSSGIVYIIRRSYRILQMTGTIGRPYRMWIHRRIGTWKHRDILLPNNTWSAQKYTHHVCRTITVHSGKLFRSKHVVQFDHIPLRYKIKVQHVRVPNTISIVESDQLYILCVPGGAKNWML